MKRRMNVLFVSVGRRVELVRAFRRAFLELELDGVMTGVDADPLAPALQVVDRAHLVPRITSPDFVPALLDVCRQEHVDLVFPLTDRDVPVLAANREAIASTGADAVVVDVAAAEIAGDKWWTYEWFMALGVPCPRTWLPGHLDPGRASYPLFVKPRRGSASAGCFKVKNARELRFFLEYVTDPIVQEWLPGPEITNDVLCDTHGEFLGTVSRQRIEARSGEVAKGVTVYDHGIAEQCRRIAVALRARGPITVQGLWNGNRFGFTEINARFGGGVPLGIAAGANLPCWLLARAAGVVTNLPPAMQYRTNVHLTRFDESFFITASTESGRSARRAPSGVVAGRGQRP